MLAHEYIDDLVMHGRHHFTTRDAIEALGASREAVWAQLRRLKDQGRVASPMRSFHVVVPLEYRSLGCLPAEQFIDQLMEELGLPYYVALLSAAERHGAAHQRPQSLQVMVPRNRSSIECGRVRVDFIARRDLDQVPVSVFNTPRGFLRYSTPEVTALELVGYPQHAGGLGHVATVLDELAEEMDGARLVEAARLSPVGWSQRLGYLLERLEHEDLAEVLAPSVIASAKSYIPLRRSRGVAGARRSPRWKVLVNEEVELDS